MLEGRIVWFNPLPDNKILDWSKFKQSADDNFKFDGNSSAFSKSVENTVDEGEIACYEQFLKRNCFLEQFLLSPQCFQKACFLGASKGVIVWEWVTLLPHIPGHHERKLNFENILVKGDNAGNQHFLLFT